MLICQTRISKHGVGRTMSRYLSSFVFSIAFCVAFSLKNIHVSQTPRITLTAKGKCEVFVLYRAKYKMYVVNIL